MDSSFLKKRSKKLLPMASGVSLNKAGSLQAETDKGFWFFFQKEQASLSSDGGVRPETFLADQGAAGHTTLVPARRQTDGPRFPNGH
jgi:hypothetical protein